MDQLKTDNECGTLATWAEEKYWIPCHKKVKQESAYAELILWSGLPPEVRKTDFFAKMVRFWSVFTSKSPFSYMEYACIIYHWNRQPKGNLLSKENNFQKFVLLFDSQISIELN